MSNSQQRLSCARCLPVPGSKNKQLSTNLAQRVGQSDDQQDTKAQSKRISANVSVTVNEETAVTSKMTYPRHMSAIMRLVARLDRTAHVGRHEPFVLLVYRVMEPSIAQHIMAKVRQEIGPKAPKTPS